MEALVLLAKQQIAKCIMEAMKNFVICAFLCLDIPKTNVRFEISIFETVNKQNFVRIRRLILFDPNTQIRAFRSKIWKMKTSKKFQISSILKFWIVLQFIEVVVGGFGWFWHVLTGFRSFWLVPGFNKHGLLDGAGWSLPLWLL